MTASSIDVRRVAGGVGAEIRGVDLAKPLAPDTVRAIRTAFLDAGVVFFRDQTLDSAQFMAFARLMGEPIEYPFVKGLPGFPEIIEVKKLEHETVNFGGVWHTDTAYLDQPPSATLLLAREIPPFGGDTLFASTRAAYEALSPGMQRMLYGMHAVNSSAKADVTKTREDRRRTDGREDARTEYVVEHPVIRTHPETGRKAIYVNFAHTVRFRDMTVEESTPILEYLYAHCTRPEFTCRFTWQVGSLAMWDNRQTLHNPVNDYHGYRRIMNRITLAGDRPT